MTILTGISMVDRTDKQTGKEISYLVYHLSSDTDQGVKPFTDFWSRDAMSGVKIGEEVEVELKNYNGTLKVSGIKSKN